MWRREDKQNKLLWLVINGILLSFKNVYNLSLKVEKSFYLFDVFGLQCVVSKGTRT